MARYASGKHSYFISDRSGFRYPYKDMKIEWTGAAVGPDEFEPKHPQLEPVRQTSDPQALQNARPDSNNKIPALAAFPSFDLTTFQYNLNPTAIGSVGSVTITVPNVTFGVTGVSSTSTLGSVTAQGDTVYAVTVPGGIGGGFYIGGVQKPTLTLNEGDTYRFDQSDSTNSGHPLLFSTTSDGTHGGGVEYTTGVTKNGTPGSSGAYIEITVASSAPTLYYYCQNHSGMGGQVNTP